ncbi:hypothetical protein FA743_19395 [Paracoccus gahaiensis]|uniref:Uncharacterized protein n=1 Tax=Paracoccus gahaiensis TaxID=1706839 RepID=A0A4U0R371_9RHOB|nr:hypothetical protein [Paracoccus gahaiensis]TJZ89036.1 hypothetical protein FA743_19395 [Paracoccus gahaiensis]
MNLIQLLAMIGIYACVVNVVFIALPTEAARSRATELHDQVAAFIVGTLFQAKFFLLFSCLIGRGIPIQSGPHAAADRPFARQYGRHLAGLAAIGVLHGASIFTGNILLIYALLGLII